MSALHRTSLPVTLPAGCIISFDCGACRSEHSVRLPQDVLLPPGTLVHTDAPSAGAPQYQPAPNGKPTFGIIGVGTREAFADARAKLEQPAIVVVKSRSMGTTESGGAYSPLAFTNEHRAKLERAAEAARAASSEIEAMDGVAEDMRFLAEDWMRAARAVVESRRRDLERYDAESERLLASSKAALEEARKQRQEHRQSSGKLYDPADPDDRRFDEALRDAEDRDVLALTHRLSGRSSLEDRFAIAAASAFEAARSYLLLSAARRQDLEEIKRGGDVARGMLAGYPAPSKNGGAA